MGFTVDRTEDEILIRLPIHSTPMEVQNALNFIRYVELGRGSKITEQDIAKLVEETRGRWWEENKERFRGVAGFERFFE